jgi:hypothetical protein
MMIIVSLLNNIRTMKSRKMSWAGNVARMREMLVGNMYGRVT